MKKRIRIMATLAALAGAALILSGCATAGSAASEPVDLTDKTVVAQLCGVDATAKLASFSKSADAKANTGQRNTLTDWGLDPSDVKAVKQAKASLTERANTACKADGTPSASPSASSDKEKKRDWDAIAKQMTADKAAAANTCKVTTNSYGLKGVEFKPQFKNSGDKLYASDSYALAFTTDSPTEARDELAENNCFDTLQGVANATGIAVHVAPELKKQSNGVVDLMELQPWLQDFTDEKNISKLAEKYDPLEFDTNITGKDVQHAQEMNQQWQVIASKLNLLYSKYKVSWDDAPRSTVNYHDATLGQSAGSSFPKIAPRDKQEKLKALVFTLTEKDVCGEIVKFGANAHDKRFELFSPKNCEAPKKPTTTKPSTPSTPDKPSTPTKPGNPGTPSTPDKPSTPSKPCTTCGCLGTCHSDAKDPKDSVAPVQGANVQPNDAPQPQAPAPKPDPVKPETKPGSDAGTKVPVQGAKPAPKPSKPAPSVPEPQKPSEPDPGTEIPKPKG